MKKIDTHQHLLYPQSFAYSWARDYPELQDAFTLEDYREAAKGCEIERTIFVEVDVDSGQHVQESIFLSELFEKPSNKIAGVIAKCLPETSEFIQEIERIQNSALKGIRRVLHTQPDELSLSKTFRRNVAALSKYDLSFDLCVTQKQLALGLDLVRACPEVRFILDHCGVPNITEHRSIECESWQQWQSGIQALAEEPNVACKFSGITVYGTDEQRDVGGLRPYLTEILEAFGSERIVWGSDWPVCKLANGLFYWSQITDQLLGELSTEEQDAIAFRNAERTYKL